MPSQYSLFWSLLALICISLSFDVCFIYLPCFESEAFEWVCSSWVHTSLVISSLAHLTFAFLLVTGEEIPSDGIICSCYRTRYSIKIYSNMGGFNPLLRVSIAQSHSGEHSQQRRGRSNKKCALSLSLQYLLTLKHGLPEWARSSSKFTYLLTLKHGLPEWAHSSSKFTIRKMKRQPRTKCFQITHLTTGFYPEYERTLKKKIA